MRQHSVSATQKVHERWLRELTAIPTAAGLETGVVSWIKKWVRARRRFAIHQDEAGNLIIQRSRPSRADRRRRPLFVTAHLDHPAFVVRRRVGSRDLLLEFRGGVRSEYFSGATVEVVDRLGRAYRAFVSDYEPTARPFPVASARLLKAAPSIQPGDIGRWALLDHQPLPSAIDGRFHARACDDLAGVAAALALLDVTASDAACGHVRVLFTRAEEVGFLGAIACCKTGTVPADSALVCLEASRSSADARLGGGPIVRVGDRSAVFSAALTNRLSAIAARLAEVLPEFVWQRKLMTGGTCEATVFTAFGYDATCVCLALDNYHNMTDLDGVERGRHAGLVGPEIISLADFHGLVTLLAATARQLNGEPVPLTTRFDALYAAHHDLL